MNTAFELSHPPINCITSLAGRPELWRVGYVNPGKGRVTLEYVGRIVGPDKIMLKDGSEVSTIAFDEYRACHWPMAHDRPKSVTLAMQNGVMGAKGGL